MYNIIIVTERWRPVCFVYLKDTISIDFKSNFNLRDTSRSWRDSSEIELAEKMVIFGHGPLSFIYLHETT